MINYLKSELYRMSQVKSTYILPLGMALMLFFMVVMVVANPVDDRSNSELLFFTVSNLLFVVPLQIPLLTQTIFADEHGNGTFKNSVSYGVSRTTLYFGKLILTLVVPMIYFSLAIGVFLLSANLMIDIEPADQAAFLDGLLRGVPALLALLFFSNLLSFVVKKISVQWSVFFALALAFPGMLIWMGSVTGWPFLGVLFDHTPFGIILTLNMTTLLGDTVTWGTLLSVMAGYGLVSTVIGLVSFKKQDI